MVEPRLVPEPTIFILYGATGDLAHRLVLPAFYRLAIAGLLPDDWRLLGNGRGDFVPMTGRHRSIGEIRPE